MRQSSGGASFDKQIRDELVRVGINGLDVGGGFTPEQLLEALRSTPDGAGGRAFFEKLTTLRRRQSGE
jgi:hypothetical protein